MKGLGTGEVLESLPTDTSTTPGNAQSGQVQISVAGIKACQPGDTTFNGCGMLIPIADFGTANGNNAQMHIVTWLAWQIWGDGTSGYNFNNIGTNSSQTPGLGCKNPIAAGGGSMKYCGLLLGKATVTGGGGTQPGTLGQIHVLSLVD